MPNLKICRKLQGVAEKGATDSRKRILKIWVSPQLYTMLSNARRPEKIDYGEKEIPVVIDPDIRADRLVLECEEVA